MRQRLRKRIRQWLLELLADEILRVSRYAYDRGCVETERRLREEFAARTHYLEKHNEALQKHALEIAGLTPQQIASWRDEVVLFCATTDCNNLPLEGEDHCADCFDPTPDCHKCHAQRPEQCSCGPYADNR